ncbi:major facilitator superfamily domain-containing protein [Xylogone sp. PMI_703]|nr:major facilitator superfamily domain-containing protein [Xylogone sp. PMI_703]
MANMVDKNPNADEKASELAVPAQPDPDVERDSAAKEFLETPEEPKDPNVVDFEGPNDPENALNWPSRKKFLNILVVSLITLLSPIASTISSAASADIMAHFHSTNESLGAFVTTVFLLGYTFGPIVIAPLSEMYGRAILYKVCMFFFIIFNVACAVANSLGSLIVYRLLAGIMGSCPVTLGAGSIADMIPAEKRASTMAAYIIGVILGPSIGPICGGYLSPAAGWRWEFWLMAIASGVMTIPVMVINETYSYVILERKTKRLRRERGNPDLRSALDTGKTPGQLFAFSIMRPLKMLISPIIFILSLYAAVVYSYLYLCFTTFPGVFGTKYGFGTGASGLVTLGYGIGSIIGLVICGATSDRLSKYLTEKHGGEAKPEYRLPIMVLGGFLTPIGLFWYGWTTEAGTHWIVPIIGTAFIGGGMIVTYMASTMYLVDAYTFFSASVTAASTIFRCLFGALLPLAGPYMYNKLGYGWGNSLLGFISIAFLPLPFIFYHYGQRIRESNMFKVKF